MVDGPVERERSGKGEKRGEIEKSVGNSGKKMGEPVSQLPIGEAAGKLQGIERKEKRNADAMQGTSELDRRESGRKGSDKRGDKGVVGSEGK